jgi:cyclin-dependent kinase 9
LIILKYEGNTEQHQLELIQNMCGSITPEIWPDVEKLELFSKTQMRQDLKRRIRERLGSYIKDLNALDLLDKLLALDPKKRIDSDEALDHDFFWTEPMPTDLKLERLSNSMFEYTAQNFKRNQFNRQPAKPAGNEQHYDRVY